MSINVRLREERRHIRAITGRLKTIIQVYEDLFDIEDSIKEEQIEGFLGEIDLIRGLIEAADFTAAMGKANTLVREYTSNT